jgi:predicted transglutaminase-like cysteine proteinase
MTNSANSPAIVRVAFDGKIDGDTVTYGSTLSFVNARVNADVVYATDVQQYGLEEYWAVAGKRGDCEDIALAKLKQLRHFGWPIGSLDIAICMVNGGGHAVLVAHTDKGDYVLDNNRRNPVLWHELPGYTWVEMSVGGSFLHWKAIGG